MNADQRECNSVLILRTIRVHWRSFAVQWIPRDQARGLTASGSQTQVG